MTVLQMIYEDLVQQMGAKEVEIVCLRRQVLDLQQEVRELHARLAQAEAQQRTVQSADAPVCDASTEALSDSFY